MNFSINKIAYDVMEMYRATHKDSDSLSIRQVYHWINVARSFIIQQRLQKNMFAIYPEEIQILSDIAITTDSGTRLKSSTQIPSTIDRTGYHGTITRVSLPYETSVSFNDGPVQIVTPKRFRRVGNRRFNSNFYYATVDTNKYLYLKPYTLSSEDKIQVEGVFQNPLEVMELNGDTDIYNADYPLNSKIVPDLTRLITNDHFKVILQQAEDVISNSADDTTIKGD